MLITAQVPFVPYNIILVVQALVSSTKTECSLLLPLSTFVSAVLHMAG